MAPVHGDDEVAAVRASTTTGQKRMESIVEARRLRPTRRVRVVGMAAPVKPWKSAAEVDDDLKRPESRQAARADSADGLWRGERAGRRTRADAQQHLQKPGLTT